MSSLAAQFKLVFASAEAHANGHEHSRMIREAIAKCRESVGCLVTVIRWVDANKELPDDEMTVLVALSDGEMWTGFRDGGSWRYVSADLIEGTVTHWAEFPPPPKG